MTDAEHDRWQRQQLLQALVSRRKQRKIGQRKIAAALGTTQSVISGLERGTTDARLSTLQAYARALGLQLETRLWVPIKGD